MVLDVLTNPDAFFARRADDPGLLWPSVIVLLQAAVGVASSYPIVRGTLDALPAEAAGFAAVVVAVSVVGAVVGSFVVWGVYAAVFHGLSALLYDGEGTFATTLSLTGWGFVPGILGGVVTGALSLYALQGVAFPSDPQQAAAFGRTLRGQPAFLAASVLGVVFLLWQAFLWTFAVKHARGVTLREAAVTVGVPVAIQAAWQLYSLSGL